MNNPRNRKTRRRRGGGSGGGGRQQPKGPVMTPLGESTYEAVFDHGNQGYGVWFDGVVREDPLYRQHWKNNRPIYVRIEEEQILITRDKPGTGDDEADEPAEAGNSASPSSEEEE